MGKKMICLLLAAALLSALCACAADEPAEAPASPDSAGVSPAAPKHETPEPEPEPVQTTPEMDLTGVNTLETVEFQLLDFFTTQDLLPPMPDGLYTHYAADAGKIYAVASFDVKNTQTAALDADELLSAALVLGETEYPGNCVVVTDGGTDLDNGGWAEVQPLETARIYYLFSVPQDADLESARLCAAGETEARAADVRLSDFVSRRAAFAVGQTFEDAAVLRATVESVSYADTLYPPMPDSYYHYYEAEAGKTYLIVKLAVENRKGSDLKYSDIAGVSCVYDGKYNYSAFAVVEEDGGSDLNGYPGQCVLSPLDSGVVYYLCEMPAEVRGGSVEIALYILGQTYYLTYAPS